MRRVGIFVALGTTMIFQPGPNIDSMHRDSVLVIRGILSPWPRQNLRFGHVWSKHLSNHLSYVGAPKIPLVSKNKALYAF